MLSRATSPIGAITASWRTQTRHTPSVMSSIPCPYPSVEELTKTFDLIPHPEGGFFKETYRWTSSCKELTLKENHCHPLQSVNLMLCFRDSGKVSRAALPAGFQGDRNFSTSILFLLPLGNHSNLHRMAASEVPSQSIGTSLFGFCTVQSIACAAYALSISPCFWLPVA